MSGWHVDFEERRENGEKVACRGYQEFAANGTVASARLNDTGQEEATMTPNKVLQGSVANRESEKQQRVCSDVQGRLDCCFANARQLPWIYI